MRTDKKDTFKNKILERYFEIEEVEDEKEDVQVDLKEKEDLDIDVNSAIVVDEVTAPKKPTVISSETVIHGNINAKNDLEVSGQVIGDLEVEGMIKVSGGTIKGNIVAKECLKLLEVASIQGDIQTKVIKIEEGAVVEGQLKMLGF